ncbi:MAG: aminotransferase class I/II-fold pyridoxal phosphate-dependent enzyme [Gemmatimonadetes bacterium]|nr:aminotransferase class I/II-fold pyridoxal phosphate-dependent enzyme [Gemmatimonadota bacterium]
MSGFRPFAMERWQSTYEYRVDHNLSESGVEPLTVRELLELAGTGIDQLPLGYGQSNGSDPLRAAIAALYPGAADAGVVVCNGSAEANYIACWRLVEPGDTVAVGVPTYMQSHGLAGNFGARIIEVPLHEERGWQPDPEEVRRLLVGNIRLLVITNPNNPTGATLDREARAALIAAAERTGAWILADEVYTGAELSGADTPSFFGQYPRTIATGSLSKAYGLPGLRIGWAVTTPAMAADLWSRKDYTTIAPGALTDHLARLALDDAVRPRITARTRDIIRRGLAVLRPYLERWGCSWRAPEAGAICYAHYPWPINSSAFAERLRAERSVLVVPGDQFAMDGYVRFGIGLHDEPHHQALGRVNQLVRSLGGPAPAP